MAQMILYSAVEVHLVAKLVAEVISLGVYYKHCVPPVLESDRMYVFSLVCLLV